MDPPCPTMVHSDTRTHVAARHAAEPLPAGERLPIRVLILEDDLDTSEALSLVLSLDEGFEANVVHDVVTCLEYLRASAAMPNGSQSHPYDVLLLDILLHDGHLGTEVLETAMVDPMLDLPPAIVCTALSGNYLATRAPGLAARNIRVLLKPFDIASLMAELRAAAHRDKRTSRQG
jgi:DNA-binding response OmpR family regulator